MILDRFFKGPLRNYIEIIFRNKNGNNPEKILYQDNIPEPFLTIPRFQTLIQDSFRNHSK